MLFASVGAAGNVILFVVTGVLLIIVGSYTLIYWAHSYLVVVQGTTAGVDRVEWPDEPIYDWLLQTLYVGSLVSCWLVPLGLVARALGEVWLPDQLPLRFLLVMGPGIWLFFPIGLLSALASSGWVPLSFRVLWRMLWIAPSVVYFYLVTALLVALALGSIYLGLFSSHLWILLLAGPLSSAIWLIHARLVGRLGWKLNQVGRSPAPAARKGHRKEGRKKPRKAGVGKRLKAMAVEDPWAAPDELEEDDTGAVPGYQLREIEAKPATPRPSYEEPVPDPYGVAGGEEKPVVFHGPPIDPEKLDRELALREHRMPNPPPTRPMLDGIIQFPFYDTTMKYLVGLSIYSLVTLGVVRGLIVLWPF